MRFVKSVIVFSLIVFYSIGAYASCKTSAGASYTYPVCTAANGSVTMSPTGGVAPYLYRWSNGDSTAVAGSLVAGTYVVTVTDASGCTVSRSFNLTSTSRSITLSTTGYSDTCNAGRGKVALNISGNGNAPYAYLWSNGQHTATASGLTSGTYSVQLSDANGCTATATATIANDGTAISITGSLTQPSCSATGGRISIVAGGGTSSTYHFLWNNGSSASVLNNLAAGSYTVTVSGSNGCTATSTYAINTPPAAITFNGTVSQPVCSSNRGAVSINPAGGTAGYTALWSTGAAGYNISGLNTGAYVVTVTDHNACTASQSYTIDSMPAVSPGGTISQPVCTSANGAITLHPSGGTAPYSYNWGNGASSVSVSGLLPGTFYVTVTDANLCTGSQTFNVAVYARPLILSSAYVADTCGSGHGRASISVTSSGSLPPFNYTWANGATSNLISALAAGTYVVSVTDANGCSATGSVTVSSYIETINPAGITASPVCTAFNGSIALSPTGGHAPYLYSWSDSKNTATINGLAPGTYIVTVTDIYGCSASKSFTLASYMRSMTAGATAAADTCTAYIGKVSVHVNSGGNAPYSYVWSNGGVTDTIQGLGAHYYTVVVTDSNGCSATAGASVSDIGTPIVLGGGASQPLCYGYTGSVSITPAGGTSSQYSALWSNGATGMFVYNLQAGVYTVTVSGSNGCKTTASYTINAADSIIMNFTVANINCSSDAGGAITLTSMTGAFYPWAGSWTGPNGFTSSSLSINHLDTGTYTINLADAHRCSTQATYSISSSGFILPQYVVKNTTCNGASNGSIQRSALMPYSSPVYTWSGPNGYTSDSCSIKNLAAGIYNLTISEAYGCTGSISDTVQAGPPIALTYNMQGVKCDSAMGGALTNTSITGATYPWVAAWSGPNGFTSNSVSINRLAGGQYQLNFTDALGCTASGNYTVDSSGAVNVNYEVSNIYCSTNNGALYFQSLTPFSKMATYNWAGSNGFTANVQSISGLSAGNYSVTVTENFGCKAVANYSLSSTFDVGVASIKYINCPAPGQQIVIHPIAGDISQLNGLHCANGISGQVQMIVTGPVTYGGVTQYGLVPTSVSGDTITWNIANFGNVNIDSSFFIIMNTNSTATPGSAVGITINVTPLAGDNNPANNSAHIALIVIRPYDPNEKQVFPDGNIEPGQKSLAYTVLFQNTGTAPAQNVFIMDTLDGHLDPSTFNITASSYPVQPVVTGNVVKFIFNGINLPDSSFDAAGSKGWVQYSVSLRENTELGSVINNTAYIYFDFNAPVATNTTANYVTNGNNTTTIMAASNAALTVSPNPAHNLVHISVAKSAVGGRVEVIDAIGRKCISATVTDAYFNLPLSGLAQGMYLLNIIPVNGKATAGKLIVE